jgi:hypothetical protein
VKEGSLEAEEVTHLENTESIESVQRVQLILKRCLRNGVEELEFSHITKVSVDLIKTKVESLKSSSYWIEKYINDFVKRICYIYELLLQDFCVEGNYDLLKLDVKFGLLLKTVMLFGSEGERRTRIFRIISGDEEASVDGQGNMYDKKENNREVHQDRTNCQVIICIKFISVKEGDSETGVVTCQEKQKLMIMVIIWNQETWKHCYEINFRSNDESPAVRDIIVDKFCCHTRSLFTVMIHFGLVFLLISCVVAVIFERWFRWIRSSFDCLFTSDSSERSEKGMELESNIPTNEAFVLSNIMIFKLLTFSSTCLYTFSNPRWSNQIHSSHHRAPGSDERSKEPILFGGWINSFEVLPVVRLAVRS